MQNQAAVEQIIEEITREVLLRLNQPQPTSSANICNCTDGSCVQNCAEKVEKVVQAGASRVTATLGTRPQDSSIARYIDHTLLKPDASQDQIAQLCYEARTYEFASVCINPAQVKLAAQLLKGSPVKVCTVVGFPLGATPGTVKAYETQQAIRDGATEIDMVINVGALKSQDYVTVKEDIGSVVRAAHAGNALVKVIIEAALLTDEEKVIASHLSKLAGADFVKTSTGFGPGGATAEDVALMRKVVGPDIGVKAAGGVRNYADAQTMIAAGATRLGASAGVRIVKEASGGAVGTTVSPTNY
jgi:deoxyribose-phosphate aldolase